MPNIFTRSQNPPRTSGHAARKSSQLKNWSRTAGQFSEVTTSSTTAATNTTVLTKAISAPRAPSSRSSARNEAARLGWSGGPEPTPPAISVGSTPGSTSRTPTPRELVGQRRDVASGAQVLLLQGGQGAVVPERAQGLVHAGDQRAARLEQNPQLLGLGPGLRQDPEDRRALHLDGGDVVAGGWGGDHPVPLP